ncbi:2-amino-5-chloromuconate deaminase CnbZ [Prosthecomicrobium pneumaticum]|uniref:Translation initiation inhibitor n=1 Tax=Prosthecomicrobium pneumaticum TaxID=81895 RepID=A0A7W9CUI4_9HYPH|nr:hypothetical protein [Prosthecomicrobium pneumaticum]MBB5752175.1 hypothetical protein [Prosthecomicrobium pneumaticum]
MATVEFAAGGYRFIPGVFQYSAGVAALPGHAIERVRFSRPVPLAEGFARIAAHLGAAGRPRAAFCACELRSPAPFDEPGFRAFNERYVGTLAQWGLLSGEVNPVARANVCPERDPPAEPSFFAFSFTRPEAGAPASFVVAGSGEVPEGKGNYRDHIVAPGDTSPAGLAAKARFVLAEMEARMAALGGNWATATGAQLYTVHDVFPLLADQIVARGAARHGLAWHFCRPPVVGIDYEMDCRRVATERVLFVD